MADTNQLKVAKNLQTTIAGMTTAGGYNYDVHASSVTLDPTVDIFTAVPRSKLPLFVIQISPDEELEYDAADQLLEELAWVIVAAVDATDRTDPQAKLTEFTKLVGDVEKVLHVDHTRGGFATDTRIHKRRMFPEMGGARLMGVVEITTRVYRTYGVP